MSTSFEISQLLNHVTNVNYEAARQTRHKREDSIRHIDDIVKTLDDAVVSTSWLTRDGDNPDFTSLPGVRAHLETVRRGKATLQDLDKLGSLLDQVAVADQNIADDILRRLDLHLASVPTLVEQIQEANSACMSILITHSKPDNLVEMRARLKALETDEYITAEETPTPPPLTILTTDVGA